MSDSNEKPNDAEKSKDRWANVPSLDAILNSFAAGIQYAAEHPEEVAAQKAEKGARFADLVNEQMARNQNAQLLGGTFRCVNGLQVVLTDLDKLHHEIEARVVPPGAIVTFGDLRHPVTRAVCIQEIREAGPAEDWQTDPLAQWYAAENDVRACCVPVEQA